MQTQFIKAANPIQQKVRQIPIQLQERVKKHKLIDQKRLVKFNTRLDKQFISSIVMTLKKDQTVKQALDSKISTNLSTKRITNCQT